MKSLLACAVATFAVSALHAQGSTYVDQDFDAGIPSTWTVVDVACPATNWFGTTGGHQGNDLDGTEFAFINSDAAGQFCPVEDYLESPVFDASASTSLRLSFDHYFRFFLNGAGTVQVFDGSTWVDLVTYTSDTGAWGAPDQPDLDLSAYVNASMQVRFKYTGNWDWWWAVDNVVVYEPLPVTYCTAGTSASGCNALISAGGTASATAASGFVLSAGTVEGSKDGLFFFGANGRQANSWGSGTSFQCVVPPVKRGGLLAGAGTANACDGSFAQDLNALWCPTCPLPLKNPGAGAIVQAQLWYRDPFNTSNQTTSLSDAIEFPVGP
jgi:hypothetical protein